MSEPLWCEVRQHYCRCGEYGPRCDEAADTPPVRVRGMLFRDEDDAHDYFVQQELDE